MSSPSKPTGRERWGSQLAFIVAAVGSAVGLGNLWRFPARSAQYGGGAFFIPYVLATVFIGVPLLILEVGLGQVFQGGHAVAFGLINPRLRMLGVGALIVGVVSTSFSAMILAWVVRLFFYSFFSSDEGSVVWDIDAYRYGDSGAYGWMEDHVIGNTIRSDGLPTTFIWENAGCSVIVWGSIWVSIFFGVRATGYFAYVTVFLPVVMVLVLLGKGLSLQGASYGVEDYIGIWDTTVLRERTTAWSDAASQVFFSLSLTLGIMTAYGSYNEENQNVFNNSCVIAGFNSLFSVVAGLAVFSALGNLNFLKAKKVVESATPSVGYLTNSTTFATNAAGDITMTFFQPTDAAGVLFNQSNYIQWWSEMSNGRTKLYPKDLVRNMTTEARGFRLAFGSYPSVLAQLPAPHFWNALFFLTLFMLGIDSQFSQMEGVVAVLLDIKIFHATTRKRLVSITCFLGFLGSLAYCTDGGMILTDIIDAYATHAMLWLGFFETFFAGWIFRVQETTDVCGFVPALLLPLSLFVPTIVVSAVGFAFARAGIDNVDIAVTTTLAVGVVVAIGMLGCTVFLQRTHGNLQIAYSDRLMTLFFGNVEYLRDRINGAFLPDLSTAKWYGGIPQYLWSFTIKFLIPPVMVILIVNSLASRNADGEPDFGRFYGRSPGYQCLGMVLNFSAIFVVLFGLCTPRTWTDFLAFNQHDDEPEFMKARHGYLTRKNITKDAGSSGTGESA